MAAIKVLSDSLDERVQQRKRSALVVAPSGRLPPDIFVDLTPIRVESQWRSYTSG